MNKSDVPNSVSFAELNEYLKDASPQSDALTYDGLTQQQIENAAIKYLNKAGEECDSPLIHKVMSLVIFVNLVTWLQANAEAAAKDGDIEQAAAYMEQVGVLKAAHSMVLNVSVDENDFTCK